MSRPTIAYVHPHLMMRTGATNFVLDTAVGLQDRAWPVVIVTGQADPAIVGDRPLDIIELGGPLPSNPRHWLELASLERRVFVALDGIKRKILFPQVHPANYWAFAYKAARPWVPCVWMCQEPSAFVHSWSNIRSLQGPMRWATIAANPPLQAIDRLMVAQTDRIVANSLFTAANVRRTYGRMTDAIVHPPVAPAAFDVPNLRRDCILSLGRLTRFKRVDLAIHGFAIARQEVGASLPPLIVAGTGPELPVLRELAAQLGIAGHVRFTGDVSEVEKRELFSRALLFVATAPQEPYGLVSPEAMAGGAPALVPDRGGLRETVIAGETGGLYRAGDAAHLAAMLVILLSSSSDLARMSALAQRHVHMHFRVDSTVARLDQFFQRQVASGLRDQAA